MKYHFEIMYKPGLENKAVDALIFCEYMTYKWPWVLFYVPKIEEDLPHDPYLAKLISTLKVKT